MAGKHHVVVDGSNLATEGRTLPSLAQLDEAVRAYVAEDPEAEIVVVVDASFEHRIDQAERQQLEDAELHGEIVSPPAGAVGRGDAFVLRIAERTSAVVLSNDSFQEFHGEHPWLFDQGRLIGGKPVPGVGWIFTPRIPVRGVKSRQATGKAKRQAAADASPPEKAAELAKAAKRVAAKRLPARLPDGSVPKIGDVWQPAPAVAPVTPIPAQAAKKTARAAKKAEAAAPAKAKRAVGAAAPAKARKAAEAAGAAAPAKARKAAEAAGAAAPAPAKAKRATEAAAPAKARKAAEKAEKATRKAVSKQPGKAARPGEPAPAKSKSTAEATEATGAVGPAAPAKARKAAEAVGPAAPAKARKAAAKQQGPAARPAEPVPAKAKRATKAAKKAEAAALAGAKKLAKKAEPAPAKAEKGPSRTRRPAVGAERVTSVAPLPGTRAPVDEEVRHAIDDAVAEAMAPPPAPETGEAGAEGRSGKKARRRRRATPPPAVNEPLAFINFVGSVPLGSEVEGEVASFTSHGAMVEVELPGGGALHCYVPLSGMADPAPRKAREVLARGERRRFVLVALDPPRRVAELALPGTRAAGGRRESA